MGLRVLITNTILAGRTGTEIFVAQLADRLLALGHDVMLYSPQVGELGLALRQRGHLVFDRIATITDRPDIIHGHHLGPLLAAIAAFPETPAIQILHSVDSEADAAIAHPQVVAHFAVSEFIARQRATPQVPRIGILRNAVDLDLHTYRTRPLGRPPSALSIAKSRGGAEMISVACRANGMDLKEIGPAHGRVVDDLANNINEADIVFASGRSALEALASGCAVVLTDGERLGGVVTTGNLDGLIALNFGVRAMPHRLSASAIDEAVAILNWTDVAAVSKRVRDVASLQSQTDRLLEIYCEAIAQPRNVSGAAVNLASLIEQYVPTHGDLPWLKLAQDVSTGFLNQTLTTAARQERLPLTESLQPAMHGFHRFGTDLPSAAWLISGWWYLEDWGVWSQPNAVLFGQIGPRVHSLLLEYRLHDSTRVSVAVAGTNLALQLGADQDGETGNRTVEIELPQTCVDQGCVKLIFSAEGAKSPLECGTSSDARHLGVGLLSLRAF